MRHPVPCTHRYRYRILFRFPDGSQLMATGRFSGMLAAERGACAWQRWYSAMLGSWVGIQQIRRIKKSN